MQSVSYMVAGEESSRGCLLPYFLEDQIFSSWEYAFDMYLNRIPHAKFAFNNPRPEVTDGATPTVMARVHELQRDWDLGSGGIATALVTAVSKHPCAKDEFYANHQKRMAEGLPALNGRQLYDHFKEKYDTRDMSLLTSAQKVLSELKVKPDENSETFVHRFQQAVGELIKNGGVINDLQKLAALQDCLWGVPGYHFIAAYIHCDKSVTLEHALTITRGYTRRAKSGSRQTQKGYVSPGEVSLLPVTKSAETVEVSRNRQPSKKRTGEGRSHSAKRAKYSAKDPAGGRYAKTCSHCGKAGHQESDCWLKHPEKRRRPETADAAKSATRDSSIKAKSDSKFVYQRAEVSLIMEVEGECSGDDELDRWKVFIDSGASDDLIIVKNKSWLRAYKDHHQTLATADGAQGQLVVEGRGKIGKVRAFYAPLIRKNVMAIRPLASRGLAVILGDEPKVVEERTGRLVVNLNYQQGYMPYMMFRDLEKIAMLSEVEPTKSQGIQTRGLHYTLNMVFGDETSSDPDERKPDSVGDRISPPDTSLFTSDESDYEVL